MKVLFVTPRIPYPLDTGAKIRTFNLLKEAKKVAEGVVLLSFVYSQEDEINAGKIELMGIEVIMVKGKDAITLFTLLKGFFKGLPLAVAKYHHRSMFSVIKELLANNDIDLVHFDHIHLGQYIDCCGDVPAVIDEHNVEAVILKRLAENEKNFLKKLFLRYEYKKMIKLEREKCSKALKIFVVSREDRKNLSSICDMRANIEVMPNGVDTGYFNVLSQEKIEAEQNNVVFTGLMDWLPNVDAVEYFCSKILPLVWQRYPNVKFYIVGKNPSGRVKKLAKNNKRIIVTGAVEDVRPYVLSAKLFAVPLRIGGGTRLKILEAMSMGKAVVSTSIGAEGLKVNDGEHLLIADSPKDFARSISMLLLDSKMRLRLGLNGRMLVEEEYEWNIIGKKINQTYKEIVYV